MVHFEFTPAHPATSSFLSNEDQRAQCSHLLTRHMRRTAVHKQRAAAPLQPHRNGYDARPKSHDHSQPPAPPLASAAPPVPWWVPRPSARMLAHTNTNTTRFPGVQAPGVKAARVPTRCRAAQFPHICPRATGRHPCSRAARTTARSVAHRIRPFVRVAAAD